MTEIDAILSLACPPGVEGVAGASDGVPSQSCKWALDHEYGCYLIECKGYLQTTDSPKGMQRIGGCSFKFCPWCGKPLEVVE